MTYAADPAIFARLSRARRSSLFSSCMGLLPDHGPRRFPFTKSRWASAPHSFRSSFSRVAVGAVLSMPLAGGLIGRFGTWPVLIVLSFANALCLLPVSLAPGFWSMAAAGVIIGATTGALDVAMNAKGLKIEIGYGRPIMSALHGTWSLGMFAGVGAGSFLLAHLTPFQHAVLIAAVAALLATSNFRLQIGGDEPPKGPLIAIPNKATLGVGALAFLALLLEGAMVDWAAIYLKTERGVSPVVPAMALQCFLARWLSCDSPGCIARALRCDEPGHRLLAGCRLWHGLGSACAEFATYPCRLFPGRHRHRQCRADLLRCWRHRRQAIARTRHRGGDDHGLFRFPDRPPVIGLVAEYSAFSVAFLLLAACSIATAAVATRIMKPHLG